MMLASLAGAPALAVTAFGLAACNTAQGLGKDIKATGNAVERAAKQ